MRLKIGHRAKKFREAFSVIVLLLNSKELHYIFKKHHHGSSNSCFLDIDMVSIIFKRNCAPGAR